MSKRLLILLTLGLVIGLGAFVVWQKQRAVVPATTEPVVTPEPAPAPVSPETPIDTSNWKTYRNEEYGFEFKLPLGWSIEKTNSPKVFYLKSENFSPVLLGYTAKEEPFYSYGEFEVVIIDNPENFSIESKYRRFSDIFAIYADNPNLVPEHKKVGQNDVLIFKTHERPSTAAGNKYTVTILKVKSKILHFDYISRGSPDPLVERILWEVVSSVSDR